MRLFRTATTELPSDGLVNRLSERMIETGEKLEQNVKLLRKVERNIQMLQPAKKYEMEPDSPKVDLKASQDGQKIKLRK